MIVTAHDFSALQEEGFDNSIFILPKVNFEVTKVEHVKAKNDEQTPIIRLKLRLTDISNNKCFGQHDLFLSNKGLYQIKKFCMSIDKLRLYEKRCMPDNELLGMKGQAMAKREPYIKDGKEYLNIKITEWLPKETTTTVNAVNTTTNKFSYGV